MRDAILLALAFCVLRYEMIPLDLVASDMQFITAELLRVLLDGYLQSEFIECAQIRSPKVGTLIQSPAMGPVF